VTIGERFPSVLAAAQTGDHAAFETIYRDVSPLILGYLRANRVTEADDIAGEVFVAMVHGIDKFNGDEKHFRSWLLTIAHRRIIDAQRRSIRRPEQLLAAEQIGDRLPPSASGEEEAIDRVRAQRLVDAMGQLSDLQREAVSLRVLADLTVRQVAEIMGKPESAVKALLRRGCASLARAIEED
jgi:RNA polymerase sigma-70 factor (ECF subfamily)